MPISLQFAIRWLSYPLVFGGSAAFMIWALYAGVPYWPATPVVAAVGQAKANELFEESVSLLSRCGSMQICELTAPSG